jgi:hypothetical protein
MVDITKQQFLDLIRRDGAITVGGLRKEWGLSREEACRLIIRHLAANNVVWVPALPHQAIFFTTLDNKKSFGLTLIRHANSVGQGGSSRQSIDRLSDFIAQNPDGLLISALMVELSLGRDSITRALKKLKADGKVIGINDSTGRRGRPMLKWFPTSQLLEEYSNITVDFTHMKPPPKKMKKRKGN